MPRPLRPRRILGVLLLGAAWFPFHRLLDPSRTGLAGLTTRSATEAVWSQALYGSLLVLVLAAALGRLGWPAAASRSLGRATRWLARRSDREVALGGAALAAALALAAAAGLYHRRPTSVDEMVQLLHARTLLAGRLTLPLPGVPDAWIVQNGTLSGGGWASVYPPFHTLLLAGGLALGAAWLVGPLATGVTVGAMGVALRRLLPDRPGLAAWATLAAATSPFVILLGATHLSHATAAAAAAVALACALQARRGGGSGWALATGAAVGALVCTRPWTGLVLGTLAAAVAVAPRRESPVARGAEPGAGWLRRATAVAAGGLPFALLLGAWNRTLWGHPLRLGYEAAFGPAHGLGLHDDPWGNRYGWLEAAAYTGTDYLHLGLRLMESPLPALALVGLGLLAAPRMPRGVALLGAWLAAGIVVVAPYWHHGMHLGPRLLYETAPAWAAAAALALAALLGAAAPTASWRGRAAGWTAVAAVAGTVALTPPYLASVATSVPRAGLLPAVPPGPALVFVHGSAGSRAAAALVAAGMRRDSVETALRRNDLCAVRAWTLWRRRPSDEAPPLALEPRPGPAPGLTTVELSPGNRVFRSPGTASDEGCARDFESDRRAGTLELEPYLWEAPPLPGVRVVAARDLGPAGNAAVLAALPGRTPWVLVAGGRGSEPRLLPYTAAMEYLWGGAAGAEEAVGRSTGAEEVVGGTAAPDAALSEAGG